MTYGALGKSYRLWDSRWLRQEITEPIDGRCLIRICDSCNILYNNSFSSSNTI